MGYSRFPTLLSRRPTMMAGLTRYDLCALGGTWLVLSHVGVSASGIILISIALLTALRLMRKFLPAGFFLHLADPVQLRWSESFKEVKK